jgi:hypothetical protein
VRNELRNPSPPEDGSGSLEGGGELSESEQACSVRQVNDRTPISGEYDSYSGSVGCSGKKKGYTTLSDSLEQNFRLEIDKHPWLPDRTRM